MRITTGNSALGPTDGSGIDVVAIDDLFFAEPVPEPSSLLLVLTGIVGALSIQGIRFMMRAARKQ